MKLCLLPACPRPVADGYPVCERHRPAYEALPASLRDRYEQAPAHARERRQAAGMLIWYLGEAIP